MWSVLSVAAAALAMGQAPAGITPQWKTWVTEAQPKNGPYPSVMTSSRYLVLGDLQVVIDRKTGKTTWDETGRSGKPFASPLSGHLVACSAANTALMDTGGGLAGIDLVTGVIKWSRTRADLKCGEVLLSYGSICILAPTAGHVAVLCDINSGRTLDPHDAADRNALQDATDEYGSATAAVNYSTGPHLLNLLTGELTSIPGLQGDQVLGLPVAAFGDAVIVYVDMNDGFAGHSSYPKYIAAYDTRGHNLWQFPRDLVRDQNNNGVGSSYQAPPIWLPKAKCLIVGADDGVYGVSTRDGRQLWHRRSGGGTVSGWWWTAGNVVSNAYTTIVALPAPSGTESFYDSAAQLWRLDPATGRRDKLGSTVDSPWIAIGGDQLFDLNMMDHRQIVRRLSIECYRTRRSN